MVVVDSDIRSSYSSQKPRKIFQFSNAYWGYIKADCSKLSSDINNNLLYTSNIENVWSKFKNELLESINKHVPWKTYNNKQSLPWVNRKLRNTLKKKARLYKYAKSHKHLVKI